LAAHSLRIAHVLVFAALIAACSSGGGGGGSGPAPVITSGFGESAATLVVSDGQTAVTTVSATHPDATETLTFAIDGGADQARFSIDATTGALSLNVAPSYANPVDADMDNVYEVDVSVSDSAGARDEQTISVVVGFAVDTLEDVVDGDLSAGDRSLREAIGFVPAGGAVTFAASLSGQTLVLAEGEVAIAKSLMIDGDVGNDGHPDITIDADSQSRIFLVDDGSGTANRDVRLSGLWLEGGMTDGDGGAVLNRENVVIVDCVLLENGTNGNDADGGAIASGPGSLTLTASSVVDNSTAGDLSAGGGIYNESGSLTITASVVAENETTGSDGRGGGIYSLGGELIVRTTDIDDNASSSSGGGIYVQDGGSFTIAESTIRYNEGSGRGGAIFANTSLITANTPFGTIVNSTIHGNHAADEGGGIYLFGGRLRISNSTITSNTGAPGGGIASDGLFPEGHTRIEVASSIVASNAPSDVEVDFFFGPVNPLTSRGGNVIGTGNATDAFSASEVIGAADPMLENLDDYGGPTPTRVPMATSPAIGAGRNPQHLATDQRGRVRTFGGSTDAGAVERDGTD
jgi:hypothetical protein